MAAWRDAAPADAPRRGVLRAGMAAAAAAVGLGGCAAFAPRALTPMRLVHLGADGAVQPAFARRADALLLMLPGAYSSPEDFQRQGLVAAVAARGLRVDLCLADAHVGYFQERTVFERLRADVFAPARAAGYRRVDVLGISLGGFCALGHAVRHPGEIDRIVLLAPYLGGRIALAEIEAAGGPRAWQARTPRPAPGSDLEREVWHWLADPRRPASPPLWLGFGQGDRFGDAHERLRALLPEGRSLDIPGGHDWPVWRVLWQQALARGVLDAPAAAGPGA